MFPSYRNQSVDMQSKSIDWCLYDGNIGRERVKKEESEILSARLLEDGAPYENVWSFRWLYIGLKQLKIEWKHDISKGGNCRQTMIYFFVDELKQQNTIRNINNLRILT